MDENTKLLEQPKLSQLEIALIERIFRLGFDYDRFSTNGQQTYKEICAILGVANPEEIELDAESEVIQEKPQYPFNEGDTYYTLEDGEWIESCWDDISEEMHDKNPDKKYYKAMNLESEVQDG